MSKYPSGKIPRSSAEYGKSFICRRGCNTRTATYTEEFVWEEIYQGAGSIDQLRERIASDTKRVKSGKRDRAKSEMLVCKPYSLGGTHSRFEVGPTPTLCSLTPTSERRHVWKTWASQKLH